MAAEYHIVYLSPNGSTKRVAEAFSQGLFVGGASISPTNLTDSEACTTLLDSMKGEEPTCLFLGSPVYFNRAVPPVMEFIDRLPPSNGTWGVPFVTFGKACSGVALWQMATALRNKGYGIAGAAKVLAVHSLMWDSDDPEGGGHPDEGDLGRIRELAEILHRGFRTGTPDVLALEALDYHPEKLASECKSAIGQPWPIMPKAVDGEACNECGTCADECPVGAITLDPLPDFGESCIDCFNCIRLCPEGAISPSTPLAEIGVMVRNTVMNINEEPLTQVFLPSQTKTRRKPDASRTGSED